MVYGDSFPLRYKSWLSPFQVQCVSISLKCRSDESYWYFGLKIPKLFDGCTEEYVGDMKYFKYLMKILMRFAEENTQKSGFYNFVYRNNVKWSMNNFASALFSHFIMQMFEVSVSKCLIFSILVVYNNISFFQ